MKIALLLVFVGSALALGHTYVFYPAWLWWRTRGRQLPRPPARVAAPPFVSVLMAVHNEERVLRAKLDSLLRQDYPADKLAFYVGSDCSTDGTNPILREYVSREPRLEAVFFTERQGKPGIINQLAERAAPPGAAHLYLITDASVLLAPDVISRLAVHFWRPELAIVDAHMVPIGLQAAGISRSETRYISGEVALKHRESVAWGYMMGPFGGCYALRSDYFEPVPANFLVDDFYLCMRVFERGGRAINDLEAICRESVSHELSEEYRRKARISAGNMQNLSRFAHLWWPPFGLPNFAFFSHKVLRWLGPIWLLGLLGSSLALAWSGSNYPWRSLFWILPGVLFFAPVLDLILRNFGVHVLALRHVRYFLLMNAALLAGFIRYAKGIRTNVWQPPKRH